MKIQGLKEYITKSSAIDRIVQTEPFWEIPTFVVGRRLKMIRGHLCLEGQIAYEERIKKEKEQLLKQTCGKIFYTFIEMLFG